MTDKVIYFTRHAQAEHNVAENYDRKSWCFRLDDASELTASYSAALNEDTKNTFQQTAELLVSSPLRRPMQTLLGGYPELKKRLNDQVILLPELQEVNSTPCDRGSEREDLEADPEFDGFDFSSLSSEWTSKKGIYDPENVIERAKWVRNWLRARPEKEIVVVAHGDILRVLTDGNRSDTPWANAEVKTYAFLSSSDEDAVVVPVQNARSTPSLTYAKNKAGAGSFRAPEPDWGIYRDDSIPVHNILNLERIEKGLDVRTTLMIKNVPTRMTDVALMAFIDAAVGRCYDFLYLRIDFGSQFNCAAENFVNFTSRAALLAFAAARLGTRWNSYHSDKLVVASYGNIQGKENLIEKFKNSAVMLECEDFRPKLFYTDGPNAGKQQPFPKSDDPHRIARSQANVRNVGLYPSSRIIFHVATAISPRI
ncbi:hypothetical protein RQP46_007772 [Phenoliferia psychrophenolica]